MVVCKVRRRYGQVVRQRIANPLFPSSNLGTAYYYAVGLYNLALFDCFNGAPDKASHDSSANITA
jgi:hypothetical protein